MSTVHPSTDVKNEAPVLVGGHPALDFVNSVFTPLDTPVDLMGNGKLLRTWIASSGVVSPVMASAVSRYTPEQLEKMATELRSLREWFREVLARWTVKGIRGIGASDLDHLNALLAKGGLQQSVNRGPEGLVLQTTRQFDSTSAVVAEMAGLCVNLLVTHNEAQVRKCENPVCSLWFTDTKRGPRRRWCSMAVCGNRMKVAAHRARQREDEPSAD
jgi:predicted RNA-binding Zn ribbon-like protein